MQTATLDKTGKIYLPKEVRQHIMEREFLILEAPDGEIILRPVKNFSSPLEAVEELRKTYKFKGPLQQLKKDARELATKLVG